MVNVIVQRRSLNIKSASKNPSPGFDQVESGRRDAGIRGTGDGPNGLLFDIANRYAGLDAKNGSKESDGQVA